MGWGEENHGLYPDKTELREALNEIQRHHNAFKQIQQIIEDWEDGIIFTDQLVRGIKNVVG